MLSWVEIDSKALISNIKNFKKIIKKNTEFYAVVKSNAYGHGIKEIVKIAKDYVDGFALNHIEELNTVYELTEKPFLIMGTFEDKDLNHLLDKNLNRIYIVISNPEQLKMLKNKLSDVKFYVKVDTGMSRLGYRPDSKHFLSFLEKLKYYKKNIVGLMTHFSNVEDVTEQSYAYYQLKLFQQAKDIFIKYFPEKKNSIKIHSSASASTILIPESQQDLVRVGISLYGLWPSLPTKLSAYNIYKDTFSLKPVLTWKTKIVHINEVPEKTKVGYGCTYQTSKKTKIAVLPIGYNEGYDRTLSNRSYVVIKDLRAMVIGRVCMNMIMVDISHIPDVKIGDEVILIGKNEKEEISADTLADICNTINYEIVTRINPNIPRIIV